MECDFDVSVPDGHGAGDKGKNWWPDSLLAKVREAPAFQDYWEVLLGMLRQGTAKVWHLQVYELASTFAPNPSGFSTAEMILLKCPLPASVVWNGVLRPERAMKSAAQRLMEESLGGV